MLDREYDPKDIEQKWYDVWLEKGYFHADELDDTRPPYSIVIPPPNVTGVLHMGHALNNTLQDVMIRYKRMDGYNALWMPGTDHAGIATQNVVEKALAERGLSRHDLGRDAFVEEVWKWREKHGGLIIHQLKRLGASCDWERTRFTMDEGLSHAVRKVFVALYRDGLIYRSDYIVNWCPRCHSALSDLEVEHEEEDGHLWHIRYPLADGDGGIVVATTRPETMLGDTAVAVNPSDERYRDMIGRQLILPVMNRRIPVIADAVVDKEFGTGAVKITPAHDLNDYEAGLRHGLEIVVVIDDSGVMNANAGPYEGLDRFECRRRLELDLEAQGYLVDKTPYRVPVGKCYRCKTTIEPYLSKQWFVRTKPLAEEAIRAVHDGRTRIVPGNWEKVYYEWMNNIRDWCISRQIWWGHRIPAWYCDGCGAVIVDEVEPKTCGACGNAELRQETDVLDTWFSSGLWPFSTMGWPEDTPTLRRFYPTDVLITGFDILFFWVARMMMLGLRFMGEVPFRDVYLHALVRDEQGQKMSKSKGNIVDPILVMDTYGADAFRFALCAFAAMGRDVRISDKRVQGYRYFVNKIWNAGKYVLSNLAGFDPARPEPGPDDLGLAEKWILTRLDEAVEQTRSALDEYRFNDAAETLYHFAWHTFCDWYIEFSKSTVNTESGHATKWVLHHVLKTLLELLHPIIPFVTEEIWQSLPGKGGESIVIAAYPKQKAGFRFLAEAGLMDTVIEVISGVRSIRGETGIAPSVLLDVVVKTDDPAMRRLVEEHSVYIANLARARRVACIADESERPKKCALAVRKGLEVYVPLEGVVDIEKELERLSKQMKKVEKELGEKRRKLDNPTFLEKAKKEVVEEQERLARELSFELASLQKAFDMLAG
ncbi:MAG TPA: valine--tRNA ligase [Deltaproteobacteria bacterium]|nr:valine--tRNA ligase [Deltaproteobacteria bacterium]HOM28275.1 valine--tRNA ligase [Deltaproteobacteria bacterium]HPP80178.1 valine--tRNA ligase [Deltaproteobacteria bacterium]